MDLHYQYTLQCYDDNAKGCAIQDPTGQIKYKQNAKIHVDNNKTMHNNGQSNATAVQVMEFIDHDINLWDGLLWLTGDSLKDLKQLTA
eukprot:15155377-Ditylum_brightwellii.AAC.1